MRKYIRITLTSALALFCSLSLTAQTKLAVKGGFNYSTARAYYSGEKQSTNFVAGGNIGLQLQADFDGPLHFSPYISYATRGFIINGEDSVTGITKLQTFIHYIDLAPVLSFHIKAGSSNRFVIAAGPLAGLAISGRQKQTISGNTSSSKMKFSNAKDYSIYDLGLHTSLGWHMKKLFIEVAYQHGFASINNNEEIDKRNIRNRTLSLNIGYFFKTFK